VHADPAEVQRFRASLKAGNNSPLVSDNFPPLVPSHFLKTQDDARKNAGPSFSSIAAKGVKPGAKISLRSPSSLLPSWNETWTKDEDWVLVPPGQEDLLRRGLGRGFHAQYSGALWEGICEVDEMASGDGASGDFRLGLMKLSHPITNPLPRTHASCMFDASSLVTPHVDKDTLYPTSCRTHVLYYLNSLACSR
jgi:hypothetical protein